MFKGAVWSWGSNAHGAIGILDEDESSKVLAEQQFETAKIPRYIRALSNMTIVQVACGNQYSAVLTANGEVWTWGNGQHGKLGHLDQVNQPLPKKIESLDSTPITKIACGQEHMMCIAKGGGLYSWGCGFFGRLGHAGVKAEFEPKEVKFFSDTSITHIWCGATSFAKDCHGNLFAWGSGGYGQIGNGQRVNDVPFPVQVPLSAVSHIACSERHVVAISDKGLFTWGSNSEGQLGLGNFKDAYKPTKVVFPIIPGVAEKDFEPIHVSCGRTYTAIVTVTGTVYTFGSGDEGELGTGNLSAKSATPVKVKLPPNTPKIVKVSCGDTFVAALTETDVLYAWGSHKTGQLGMGELYAEERMEKRINENIGTKQVVEHDNFESVMGFTPKKGKKTRNTSTPKKKAEIKQQAQQSQSQSRQPAMAALTNLHTGRPVKWLYGVLDIVCGLSHSIAVLDKSNRVLQLARDGDLVSLHGICTDDMAAAKSDARKQDMLTPERYNALHWASLRNHPKVVSYLLQNMGMTGLLNEVCKNSYTPLHLAAIHGHVDVIKLLMEAKADADMQDSAGNTALHHAATAKRLDICAALILAGANANIENRKSKKPLEFFSLQESFDLKKKIKSFDVAIYYTPSEYKFCKNLRKKIETFHIVCSLNEEKHDPKTFIKASQAMIFVLSNDSAISPDSLVYLRLAKELKKHVYPIWRHKANMSAALESLIYRNQLVDFTDDSKFIDSAAQLVAGLRNIFEDKKDSEQDSTTDDSAEVDAAFSKMVQHPNMIIPPTDLVKEKKKYLYLCHDQRDSRQAALLAASLCDHDFICCYYNDDTHIVSDLITNCWTFLLVLSSRSAGSSIIRDQIALAENRQKLILPVLVQKSSISLDPAMTYTLARTARFPFFVGDNDVRACVEKLVDAVRLAKKVSLKSERLKNLREEVVVTNDKLSKSNKYIAEIKAKVTTKKTMDMEQPVNWR